ncbi:MAG TPA: ATP-binding domain-containing protein [Vicinamibacterales bacterium]|nr:ATP-binding domain-containing protein [Vicinamibacterales bacterium]
MQTLDLPSVAPTTETIARIERLSPAGFVNRLTIWVRYQARATGRTQFQSADIERLIARELAFRRLHGVHDHHLFRAMTVQQAKNREFAGVIVIWPFQVGGDAEHRRRLLYNALTRARRWCTIVIQGPQILTGPPFR